MRAPCLVLGSDELDASIACVYVFMNCGLMIYNNLKHRKIFVGNVDTSFTLKEASERFGDLDFLDSLVVTDQ